MKSPIQALIWEQVWKNRIVFPALAVLMALSATLAHALNGAPSDAWWRGHATGLVVGSFLASLLLVFAPFTLMESSEGWRMNSMTTRWFVLPVRTPVLVLVPLTCACTLMALLMSGWGWVLGRLAQGFDTAYFGLVMVAGIAAVQALAWGLPRRPGQFWPVAAVVFAVALLFALAPQDRPQWVDRRSGMMLRVACSIPVFALAGLLAAGQNRRGVWSGELPFIRVWEWLFKRRSRVLQARSPAAALFWQDTLGLVRGFALSWGAVSLLVLGWQFFHLFQQRRAIPFSVGLVAFVCLKVLPYLGMVWLAAGGLFLGSEPGAGFRTRLTSFRATWPITAGTFATQRITAAVCLWLTVWAPSLAMRLLADMDLEGGGVPGDYRGADASLALFMALSAHVLVGALPWFLSGRVEGYPNMLLSTLVSWTVPWVLLSSFSTADEAAPRWWPVVVWLAVKVVVTGWALWQALAGGHITWRYAVALPAVWLGLVSLMVTAFPVWSYGPMRALAIAAIVPLGRLALCPLAVAANRHR